MSLDLLYSVMQRATLRPSDLTYNRRARAPDPKEKSKGTGSKEHKFQTQEQEKFDEIYEKESKKSGYNIDDTV
jgi:hypothetical protein